MGAKAASKQDEGGWRAGCCSSRVAKACTDSEHRALTHSGRCRL